jgi:hypothetical protein
VQLSSEKGLLGTKVLTQWWRWKCYFGVVTSPHHRPLQRGAELKVGFSKRTLDKPATANAIALLLGAWFSHLFDGCFPPCPEL